MPVDVKGLSEREARENLKKFGPNVLPEKPPPTDFAILLSQIKSPLVYVLILAAAITFFLSHTSDTVIILLAVVINTVLGFIQEKKAGNALVALKKLVTIQSEVIRDGKRKNINTKEVVPADVVVLTQGDKVPGDGKLLHATRLYLNEAVLTGESVPVNKNKDDEVYMGTIVAAGTAFMFVEKTGAGTKIGKIALEVQEKEEETPLKKQLTAFAKQLVLLIAALIIFVYFTGLIFGRGLDEMFTTSVALAVSAIPEGLLVGLTVVLAIGMQRILKRKGLVRSLTSAETLGGVTVVCLDKTGTLTKGLMQPSEVVGEVDDIAKQMILANDLDDPIVIAGFEWAKKHQSESLLKIHKRLDALPFSPKDRFFASLNRWNDKNIMFVNGAPDYVVDWTNLSKKQKNDIKEKIEELTSDGKRLIGLARKEVSQSIKKINVSEVKNGLTWVGLIAFSDPVRKDVAQAIEKVKKAGIRPIVITGDYPKTAISVMKEIGFNLSVDEVLLGKDLEKLGDNGLTSKLAAVQLFARTTPEQKLSIVNALKANGEVVAMMGDGVNDAPALAKADIGIVVGDATDVARESADLVLLDSKFETVVAAIEEGRGIYDNVRKILIYLMSSAFNGIIAVTGSIILGLPLPVTAGQILWVNLVTNGFPDLALTVDPKKEGLMKEPPRSTKQSLVEFWMKALIAVISLTSGFFALGLFVYVYNINGDILLARSVAFIALGVNSLVYVFSARTLKEPFWRSGLFDNKWLLVAIGLGFILQLTPFISDNTKVFFGVTNVPLFYWGMVLFSALSTFVIIELLKVAFRGGLNRPRK